MLRDNRCRIKEWWKVWDGKGKKERRKGGKGKERRSVRREEERRGR